MRLTAADQRNHELGSATADAAGAFSVQLTLPTDVPPGSATVIAQGAASNLLAQAALTVAP